MQTFSIQSQITSINSPNSLFPSMFLLLVEVQITNPLEVLEVI